MGPSQKNETAIAWLAKSMGFVDRVCCYSVSGHDFTEDDAIQVDMRSGIIPESWTMHDLDEKGDPDDNSIVYRPQSTYLASHGKIGQPDHRHSPSKGRGFGKENGSNRSVSTRSTVTTSSTTTVVTSCKVRAISGDSSLASLSPSRTVPQQIDSRASHHITYRSERHRPTPDRIYCHAYSDGELYEAPKVRPANS
jgi:hypothetical protein